MSEGGLSRLNRLPEAEARAEFLRCCGSARWAAGMAARRPFANAEALFAAAGNAWRALGPADWLEAFTHHPRIGERALRERFASTAGWAGDEQKGVDGAAERVLTALAEGNRAYEAKFGHVFLICATGKTGPEMLEQLTERLANSPETELRIAAAEQDQITRIRLEKLLR